MGSGLCLHGGRGRVAEYSTLLLANGRDRVWGKQRDRVTRQERIVLSEIGRIGPKGGKHRAIGAQDPEARKQRESGAVRSLKMGERELLSQHISSHTSNTFLLPLSPPVCHAVPTSKSIHRAHVPTQLVLAPRALSDHSDSSKNTGKSVHFDTQPHPLVCPVLEPTAKRIVWDIRFRPGKAKMNLAGYPHASDSELNKPAVTPPVTRLRLVSKLHPWVAIAKNPHGVTVGNVLDIIYATLQEPICEAEWWIVSSKERARVGRIFERECARGPGTTGRRSQTDGVRRVDWVGDETTFLGLEKDEDFIRHRIQDPRYREETWVVALGANSNINRSAPRIR
ncbi:hypothetical protein RHS01_08945 [Rhizoctonia solani]|uniref:DUF6699 domain-containing protein n=1 Tax=Rhizoctonia solani TaxID=456999 RepID=A0A8H7I4I4_9AGAM|nr:hypothetical protein RHS01_08945 [Rhizoctonia solani]